MLSGIKYLLVVVLSALFIYLGYFNQYSTMAILVGCLLFAFIIYFYLVFFTKDKTEVNALLWFSIWFRFIFLFSIPFFSSDYLRIIFDGKLILNGFNPYLFNPADVLSNQTTVSSTIFGDSFALLTNNHFYSTSFPITHLLSLIPAFLLNINPLISLLVLRIPIIIADFIIIKFLIKIIESLNLSYSGLLIYALNPLVIIGLTANINFIGLMLCFFIVGLYFIINNKWLNSIPFFALSTGFSLFPFLLFPLVFKKINWAKSSVFLLMVAILFITVWSPFYHEGINETIARIPTMFINETHHFFGLTNVFNRFTGSSLIILSTMFAVALISISISRARDWISVVKGMLFCLTAFILLYFKIDAVYFVLLVGLSVLVQDYQFAIVWSLLAVINFPYFNVIFENNYWIMPVEFSILLMVLLLELLGSFKSLSE